jgi:hypothetical protein
LRQMVALDGTHSPAAVNVWPMPVGSEPVGRMEGGTLLLVAGSDVPGQLRTISQPKLMIHYS